MHCRPSPPTATSDAEAGLGRDGAAYPASHTLDDLCALTSLPRRTVRYYVQLGLVDRPEGETRAARYGPRQLDQLLSIRKWAAEGLSLDRIRGLLQGEPAPVQPLPSQPGEVSVRSHVAVAPGIELVIDPGLAALTPEQLRAFSRSVIGLLGTLGSAVEAAPRCDAPDPPDLSDPPAS